MSSPPAPSVRFTFGVIAAIFLSALVIAVALSFAGDWFGPPATTTRPPSMMALSTPFILPGVEQPPTYPAATAAVPDDAEVIGVSAGGRHRAYLVPALSRATSHVVNDVLGEAPVTVTFCDRSQCARIFTDPGRSSPLKIDLGGIWEERLLLKLGNVFYFQDSGGRTDGRAGPFPYPSHPFVQTSWKEWKEAHPETDVFVGVPAGEPEPPDKDED